MSEREAFDAFAAKWRARWPEWSVAEAFVPRQQRTVLVFGTLVTAAGFIVAGAAGGFVSLLVVLLAAGLGSGVQHPLASSIVSPVPRWVSSSRAGASLRS